VRVRKVIPALEKAGIAAEHVAASMAALRRADEALEAVVADWWNENVQGYRVTGLQDYRMDVGVFRALQDEMALRVMARVQDVLLPGQMPVRASKRLVLLGNIRQKAAGKATLGGVVWSWNGQALAAKREKPAL
jgi:P2-related tail formation protein